METGFLLFTADWASEACASARQVFLALKAANSTSEFAEVGESPETDALFNKFNIEAVPTLLKLASGREVGRVVGAVASDLIKLVEAKNAAISVNETTNKPAPAVVPAAPAAAPTDEDLIKLINGSPLMMFIKGTPEAPQCGFTGQLIRLLAAQNLHHPTHYKTFNILADSGVREALKKYSQWPTYPQIYWHGELLGGLDILKEMIATGQLEPILQELLK